MKITSKDIKNLQRSSDLLEIYSRDREEYDLKESREAKRLSVFMDKFVAKIMTAIAKKPIRNARI